MKMKTPDLRQSLMDAFLLPDARAGAGTCVVMERVGKGNAESAERAESAGPNAGVKAEGVKAVQNQKERYVPAGFLVDIYCPTEERLKLRLDVTSLSDHLSFVYGLQDLLNLINSEYTKKARVRICTVRYQKEGDLRRKILEFSPYPSPIINELKSIRSDLYDALNKNCLVLATETVGTQRRNLYFLPAGNTTSLFEAVEGLNYRLDQLRAKVREFEEGGNAAKITQYLKPLVEVELRAEIPPVSTRPMPFALDRAFVESFVEDAVREIRSIGEERDRLMRQLKEEVELRRKELLQALEKDLKEKLIGAIEALEEASRSGRRTKELADALEAAANAASSLNLEIAEPLEEALEGIRNKEKPAEVAGRLVIDVGADLEVLKRRLKSEPLLTVW